jgi:surface antigen
MGRALRLASLAALVAALSAFTPPATAEDIKPSAPPACNCLNADPCPRAAPTGSARPKFAGARSLLDENDEIAALEAVRVALSEVGDGASYVWHRANGRLSGIVQPTGSFKDLAGRVCRHIILVMSTADHTGKIEGVACRLGDGRWQLDG